MVSFLQVIRPKCSTYFSCLPCVLHAPTTWSSLIWWPKSYSVKRTTRKWQTMRWFEEPHVFLIFIAFNSSQSLQSKYFLYEGVSKSFRTESTMKYTLTTINTRWEATQRVMAAKLTRLTHKIAIQLHLVAKSCIICSSRSRRPVRKLLDTFAQKKLHTVASTAWCVGCHSY
jgi:hypothetical protein